MKFEICNNFSEHDVSGVMAGMFRVTPFDYDKFKHGRIVEFDTEEEVLDFMKEAKETIKFVENQKWDFITVGIYPNFDRNLLTISILHEWRD